MSCAPSTSIPHPPTTLSSCAVPIGGSNSSILHACCNGHINALATYSAPDTTSTSSSSSSTPPVIVNSEDNDGCFLYCITDSPSLVQTCLKQKMDEENVAGEGDGFACFEADKVVRREKGRRVVKRESGYANAGVRVSTGWGMRILLGVSVVGIVMGGL
ncbi:argininosuccinate lyase [Pyrenophora seminiperda CCB06]|uniref:Argininosuccinate lyase n=1 Tax=Pyrenophora seminiperda CCB06 TaxID=1302712 RepID=A0A3M7MIU2_9PLEO|nr:argininosuccinate lyase [Pyrenophora seminiperda CCB06]